MASAVARPQLRGLLSSNAKKNFAVATVFCAVCTVAYRFGICDSRKARYTKFYEYVFVCVFFVLFFLFFFFNKSLMPSDSGQGSVK
jgi:hypothetical protein